MKDIDDKNRILNTNNGIEPENTGDIKIPFDPKKVDIITNTMVLSNVYDDIINGDLVLNPDFQRHDDVWDNKKRSRLIESIILRVPLPTFYFDITDDEKYEVVDGLQRLKCIKDFINNEFHLSNLEYLTSYNGFTYENLENNLKRRIKSTQIVVYVIRMGTPDNVKNSIFKRINTGGEPLVDAEIRHAMFRGQASDFIKELAELEIFKKATNNKIRTNRMLDREFVNRFFALYFIDDYSKEIDYEDTMIVALRKLKESSKEQLKKYKADFTKSMSMAYSLLGNNAFRKLDKKGKFSKINRTLFECTSVSLIKYKNNMKINKEKFLKNYKKLLKKEEFDSAITNATFNKNSIETRYRMFKEFLEKSIC